MERVIFDYRKLRGRIKEVTGSQKKFAKSIGLSQTALSQKLMNRTYFNQAEIERAVNVLGICPQDVSPYFFTRRL